MSLDVPSLYTSSGCASVLELLQHGVAMLGRLEVIAYFNGTEAVPSPFTAQQAER